MQSAQLAQHKNVHNRVLWPPAKLRTISGLPPSSPQHSARGDPTLPTLVCSTFGRNQDVPMECPECGPRRGSARPFHTLASVWCLCNPLQQVTCRWSVPGGVPCGCGNADTTPLARCCGRPRLGVVTTWTSSKKAKSFSPGSSRARTASRAARWPENRRGTRASPCPAFTFTKLIFPHVPQRLTVERSHEGQRLGRVPGQKKSNGTKKRDKKTLGQKSKKKTGTEQKGFLLCVPFSA